MRIEGGNAICVGESEVARFVALGAQDAESGDDGAGHTMTKTKAGGIAADRLKSFIERVERLEAEQAAIAGDKRDIYSEAKGVGYDVKTMRKVVALRKMDAADRDEQETLLDTYLHALGMVDRIEARAAAGESARQIAAAEGVSKSTAHRVSQKARIVENGTGEESCGGIRTRSSVVPLEGEDAKPIAPQPDDHSTGMSPAEMFETFAEMKLDSTQGETDGHYAAAIRRPAIGNASHPGHRPCDEGGGEARGLRAGRPYEAQGGGVQEGSEATGSPQEGEAEAPRSVGAVASPQGERVASPIDDDLEIPPFLKSHREGART